MFPPQGGDLTPAQQVAMGGAAAQGNSNIFNEILKKSSKLVGFSWF